MVLMILIIMGCAEVKIAGDIVVPDDPVCNEEKRGTAWDGQICSKIPDGSYKWVVMPYTRRWAK